MKKLKIIFLLIFPMAVFSQPFEHTKSVVKTFAATKDCSVQITNKYGDVQVVPWDKDSVKFEISVKVVDKKDDAAVKKISNIDFNFTSTPYYVIAKTIFLDKNSFIDDIGDMASSLISSGNYVNITWVVMLPSANALTIDNKYGNVYTTDHSNAFQLTLSNGDFKANNLTGDSKINISFGNASVNEITKGKIEASYSDNFEIKKAGKLNIVGRSSKFNFGSAESLELDSKRDKFNIDTLNYVAGTTDFSYITAGSLKSQLSLNTSFGELKIQDISNDFKSMNLAASYTDISLTIPSGFSSSLDATYKKTEINCPVNLSGIQKEVVNEDSGIYKLKGFTGSDSTSVKTIVINASSGSLTIISK